MSRLTRFLNVFRQASLDREFDEELRFHLDESVARHVGRGLSRQDAEAEAARRFGSIERARRGMQEVRIMERTVFAGLLAIVAACVVGGIWIWTLDGEPPQPPRVYQPTDAGITRPRLVRERKPDYPEAAKLAGVQGEVFVECTVLPDGTCRDIEIARSLDPMWLDREVVRALEEWRFTPGTLGGEPVPVRVNVEFRFTLR